MSSGQGKQVQLMCTCGPALDTAEKIAEVIKMGVTVIRINFSHGGPEDHERYCDTIRKGSELSGKKISIMGDIQGPKFRIGLFEGEILLSRGQEFQFDDQDTPGSAQRCYLPHPEVFQSCHVGDTILLNDGIVHLKAVECSDSKIRAVVTKAGVVSSRKGISLPHVYIKTKFPTDRDFVSINTANRLGIDIMMLSFIQTAEDVVNVRKLVNKGMHLMAKVEMPTAFENLPAIIAVSDSILIARGDLGVEGGLAALPGRQKSIIRQCVAAGIRVYSATQHLESMVTQSEPTYGECNDVQNIVLDGIDGILLTGETANGQDPVGAVRWLRQLVMGQ